MKPLGHSYNLVTNDDIGVVFSNTKKTYCCC